MNAEKDPGVKKKKLYESSIFSGIGIPLLIVAGAVVIVFGITRLINSERNYKDLVRELESKTFGNRWVAAFELSKILARQKIPVDEHPWFIQRMEGIYRNSEDARTRNFVVVAVGSLKNVIATSFLMGATADPDSKVQFNAIVGIGNLPSLEKLDLEKFRRLFNSNDPGLLQSVALTTAQHELKAFLPELVLLIDHSDVNVRFAAATAAIIFQHPKAVTVLRNILKPSAQLLKRFDENQWIVLKLRLIDTLKKYPWREIGPNLLAQAQHDASLKVSTRAQEALNLLKK